LNELTGQTRFGKSHAAVWLLSWAALLLIFWPTAAVIVDLWQKSDTYAHAFLVFPIVAWLVWRVRGQLAVAPVKPVRWLLLPFVAALVAWLLSEAATVGVVGHFALATLLVLAVPALFGWAVARVVAFPLAFVYFAVPFGDALMPLLMEWTADVTVWALRITGVPVYREGLQFLIPTGSWSVVEACSGLRYLIASLMVGSLFAYLNYSSTKKRVLFFAASIVVPILANWARAYLIVMIGHLSSNKLAAGVDHLVYGWLFFGLVIGVMFVVGARFADAAEAPITGTLDAGRLQTGVIVMTVALLALGGGGRGVALQMDAAVVAAPARVNAPPAQQGWQAVDGVKLPWLPGFRNPAATAEAAYRQDGSTVHVWMGYYRQQGNDSKLVTSVNRVVRSSQEDPDWAVSAQGSLPRFDDALPGVRTTDVRAAAGLGQEQGVRLRTWRLYWVDGRWVSGDIEAKLWQVVARLRGRGDDGAVVLLATPMSESADRVLEKFARAHLAALDRNLASTRDTR
jgi:exosortase A